MEPLNTMANLLAYFTKSQGSSRTYEKDYTRAIALNIIGCPLKFFNIFLQKKATWCDI